MVKTKKILARFILLIFCVNFLPCIGVSVRKIINLGKDNDVMMTTNSSVSIDVESSKVESKNK